MSNFSFLERYDPKLFAKGSQAEKHLYHEYDSCLLKLRGFDEHLVGRIVRERRIHVSAQNPKCPPTLDDKLKALTNEGFVPKEIKDDLYEVKKKGNLIHEDEEPYQHAPTFADAASALEAAHRTAVWFVRGYLGENVEISAFVMPEPAVEEPPANKRLFDTRKGKWVAVILAALGVTFGGLILTDETQNADRALRNTVRLVALLLIFALLALPLFIFANGLSVWEAFHWFVSSLSKRLDWSEYLIRSLGLGLLLPFCYSVRLAFSQKSSRRVEGFAVLILMAVGYNVMFYYATKDWPLGKFYERTDEGTVIYDRAGNSPVTGKPLLPMTPDVWREYQLELKFRMTPVDPASAVWFNPNTDTAMLWYSCDPNGKYEFYKRPGYDPNSGVTLLPVTHELYGSWFAARQPKIVKPETPQEALRTILHPAASGGTGALLVGKTPAGREEAEALARHLSGVNTSAFSAAELERRGYASKLLQGDSSLVREALSITHLNSLVVAEVNSDCTKRSSLDSDLVSCDLTANARKFDSHGNSAGSRMVQSSGAGFNQDAALDAAAQRASANLSAFANQ